MAPSIPPLQRTEARTQVRRGILRQTMFALGAALLVVLSSGVGAYQAAAEYDEIVHQIAVEDDLRAALGHALQLTIDTETAQRGYLLTANPEFLEPHRDARVEMGAALRELHLRLDQVGEHDLGERLLSAIRARNDFSLATIALAENGRAPEARAQVVTGVGLELTERVRELVDEVERRREQIVRAGEGSISRARTRTGLALGLAALLTLGIVVSTIVTVRRDLLALEASARALEDGERRFRQIAETSSDLIRVQDRQGRTLYASPSSIRLLGYTPDELRELEFTTLIAGDDRERVVPLLEAFVDRGEAPPPIVHRLRHRDHSLRWFESRIEAILEEDGGVRRFHWASRDVTERVGRERRTVEQHAELAREAEALRAISTRDDLTGLLNRRGLHAMAEGVARAALDAGKPVLVYFCDLDGLKAINDTLGHEEGDRAIVDAARVLRALARATDLVARLGGDEMVVLGVGTEGASVTPLRERLQARLDEHNANTQRRFVLSISVGLALWDPTGPGTLDELLVEADAAMYRDKLARKQSRAATTPEGEPSVRGRS